MKYSYPRTEITVQLESLPQEVKISVTDLGPGIRPQDQDRIFTRIYRTQQATEEKVEGLGLGLYISKGLVEAHGGRMWVESVPGEYATFRFTLPVALSSENKHSPDGRRQPCTTRIPLPGPYAAIS